MSELQICPVCGSEEFSKFYHNIIIIDDRYSTYEGHTERRVEHIPNLRECYECDGCSVHFSNPRKFLTKIGDVDEI